MLRAQISQHLRSAKKYKESKQLAFKINKTASDEENFAFFEASFFEAFYHRVLKELNTAKNLLIGINHALEQWHDFIKRLTKDKRDEELADFTKFKIEEKLTAAQEKLDDKINEYKDLETELQAFTKVAQLRAQRTERAELRVQKKRYE